MPDQSDKTEPATPRRRQESRKRGQVARSVELTSAFLLLIGMGFLYLYGPHLTQSLIGAMRLALSLSVEREITYDTVLLLVQKSMVWFLLLLWPIFLMAFLLALIINLLQVGVVFSGQPLIPSFEKINPAKGFQRLFSMRSFVELTKSIFKITLVTAVAFFSIRGDLSTLMQLSGFDPAKAGLKVAHTAFVMSFRITLIFVLLAILDYIYQRIEFERGIRMSKKEIKEEYKQLEGDPFLRQRIRQRQREIVRRRMLQEVRKADVVITNPTHIAIAIVYDQTKMRSPRVIAKGIRLIAERIMEIAKENHVPIYQNPPLAQALYKACDIGDEIPASLYGAVAEVLAFVYTASKRKVSV